MQELIAETFSQVGSERKDAFKQDLREDELQIMDPFHFETIENDIKEHGWVLDHLFDDLEVG